MDYKSVLEEQITRLKDYQNTLLLMKDNTRISPDICDLSKTIIALVEEASRY